MHTGAVVGKSITEQFYGDSCGKNYYIGCSTGGRQGWKAVQRNAELFDGVVAGAPVIDVQAHVGFNASSMSHNEPPSKNEVLKQCDGLDGAHNGILEDVPSCVFDWTPLLYSSTSNSMCLVSAQIEATAQLFRPLFYHRTSIHPGQGHGFEPAKVNWLYSELVLNRLSEAFHFLQYEVLSWDPTTFTLQDILKVLETDTLNINTFNGDISAYQNGGGNVLHWHGAANPLISIKTSDLYYDKVGSTLNASIAQLDESYYYLRASGVGHCRSGSGVSFMGELGGLATADTPDDNMLRRIVRWVENGEAPEYVRGPELDSREAGRGR